MGDIDPKELERLARKAFSEADQVEVDTDQEVFILSAERGHGRDVVARLHIASDHERAPQALIAALRVLAGEDDDAWSTALDSAAREAVDAFERGQVPCEASENAMARLDAVLAMRGELKDASYEHYQAGYDRAIRDVCAWLDQACSKAPAEYVGVYAGVYADALLNIANGKAKGASAADDDAATVPDEVHERGWQWRPVSEDTAFAPPFGTVRACIGCGCLVVGGPTRCVPCAKGASDG